MEYFKQLILLVCFENFDFLIIKKIIYKLIKFIFFLNERPKKLNSFYILNETKKIFGNPISCKKSTNLSKS